MAATFANGGSGQRICRNCQELPEPDRWTLHQIQPNIKALLLSASNGCPLCCLISEQISHVSYFEGSREPGSICLKRNPWKQTPEPWEIIENYEDGYVYMGELNAYRTERERLFPPSTVLINLPDWLHQLGPTFSDRESCAGILGTGKQWLASCLNEHVKCSKAQQSSFCPARLVRIQRLEGRGDPLVVSVVETSGTPIGSYLTLSHRWGGEAINDPALTIRKLTKDTLLELSNGISIERIPRSYSDAVSITYLLGYEYIWIDGYCIIQNSTEDWARESSQMHLIYQNSVCTLSQEEATGLQSPFPMCRPQYNQLSYKLTWESREAIWLLPRLRYFQYAVEQSSLFKRAWVFQERMLSSRILHFGDQQVFWQCHDRCLSESQTMCKSGWNQISRNYLGPDAQVARENSGSNMLRASWIAIVQHYSSKRLTHATDKLAALAGLSRHFAAMFQDQYLAGLWMRTLAADMSWYSNEPNPDGPKLPRRAGTNIPSWSWASMTGSVRFRSNATNDRRNQATWLLDHRPDFSTIDHFGGLNSYSLRVRGRLMRCFRASRPSRDSELNPREKDLLSGTIRYSVQIEIFPFDNKVHLQDLGFALFDIENPGRFFMSLWLSPALILAVQPIKDSKTEYRRIGLVCVQLPQDLEPPPGFEFPLSSNEDILGYPKSESRIFSLGKDEVLKLW